MYIFISLAPAFCTDDEFRCANGEGCIFEDLRCDMIPDCQDESDELDCRYSDSNKCPPPNLFCDTKCVTHDKICNGIADCLNGEDEAECNTTIEVEKCDFGACSQLCERTSNSKPRCKCSPGFMLLEDGFSCKSNASDEPFLVYSNRYDIRITHLQHQPTQQQMSLDSERQNLPLISHLRNVIAIDYFFNRTDGSIWLFFSDISLDQIFKGRLYQGSRPKYELLNERCLVLEDIEPVVSFGVWTAEGLSVDWIGHHVYWVSIHPPLCFGHLWF